MKAMLGQVVQGEGCPSCGSILNVVRKISDMGIPFSRFSCAGCKYTYESSPVKCKDCW